MRALSEQFMANLIKSDGLLFPILSRVKKDHTLMLAIRESNINIYYRGGNILKLTEDKKGYKTFFDSNYSKLGKDTPTLPDAIEIQDDAEKCVISFPILKNFMDEYFSVHRKTEQEFQQLIARMNNNSSISNESEYFITDIEVTDSRDSGYRPRFDMMAIRWLAGNDRKTGEKCKAALIEMKYGDGALSGDAGLLKHLDDAHTLISNKEQYEKLLATMESQFNQLDQLGLMNFKKGKSNAKVRLDVNIKPEVIFILADHNPRSQQLKKILTDPKIDEYEKLQLFDLRFFVASFAGYGLHAKRMLSLAEFRKLL